MSQPSKADGPRTRSHQARRAAVASVAGSVLEFYDFAIYGLAAALVFGPVFFPSVSPTVGLLSAFATLGVGFVARPLGGMLFGHLGDRWGRRNVLVVTLLIMGTATVLIGCLPGYATIGFWAPLLLALLRLIQGLAFGGEWGGAVLLASEHAAPSRRGLYAALPNSGISAGLLLGNLAFLAVSRLDPVALQTWGWRIPFWAGALLVVVGIATRRNLDESPEFQRAKAANAVPKAPLLEVLRRYPLQIILSAGLVTGVSATAYTSSTYSLAFAKQTSVPGWQPITGVLVASAIQLVWMPLAGALTDRFGQRLPFYLGGALAMAVTLPFFFSMVGSGSVVILLLGYILVFGLSYGLAAGVFPVLLTESFDTTVAYSGISLGMQLGNVVGGFTPFLATLVVASSGVHFFALCVAGLAVVSAICAVALVRSSRTVASPPAIPAPAASSSS
ncbi:MFS transporter [Pseudonocardia xishanensis]|uniref:MFS transporter n=1 Tax=Pseudonocardia xishanensis TaxID=630995 RepID=A0ABP8RUV6_9PSEU